MFLRNCWYAAGFSEDFGRTLTARTYLGEAVVIYRAENGTPVALEDRCAHRRLPLSMGRLDGNRIECAYHGLLYDESGTCIKDPWTDERTAGRAGARISSSRSAYLSLDLDGRSQTRRPEANSRLQRHRRSRREHKPHPATP